MRGTSLNYRPLLLLLPAIATFAILLVLPLINVLDESLRFFEPGRIGAAENAPYTLANYLELFNETYVFYFAATFRIGGLGAVLALVLAYPIAYFVARMRSSHWRRLSLGFLIAMMFLSALVRVYALELTFGPVGYGRALAGILQLTLTSRTYTELVVIAGLVHFLIPIAALTLVGTIQNIDPRLSEAAQALGASRWKAHLTITVPLSVRGAMSAFLICFTLSISAFVVPMILGKGRILFISNLVYSRFSEVANYPSGSAIAIVLLLISMFIVICIVGAVNRLFGYGR